MLEQVAIHGNGSQDCSLTVEAFSYTFPPKSSSQPMVLRIIIRHLSFKAANHSRCSHFKIAGHPTILQGVLRMQALKEVVLSQHEK